MGDNRTEYGMADPQAQSGPEAGARPPARRRRRRGVRVLLAAAGVVLAGLAAAVWFLPVLVRPAVEAAAASLGVRDITFEIERIGWREAALSGIALGDPATGPGARIEAVRLTYSPLAVLRGRVDAVELDRPVVAAAYGPEGFDPGPLAPLLEGGGEPGGGVPVGTVRVVGGRAVLRLRDGEIAAAIDGEARLATAARHEGEAAVRMSGLVEGGLALAWRADDAGLAMDARDVTAAAMLTGLGARVSLADAAIEVASSGSGVRVEVRGLAGLGFEDGPVAGASLDLDLAAAFDAATGTASAALAGCAPLALELSPDAGWQADGMSICPDADRALFAAALLEDAWSGAAHAQVPGFAVRVDGVLAGTAPAAQVSAEFGAAAPVISARLSGGDVTMPEQAVRLAGFDARVSASPGAGAGAGAGTGAAAKLVVSRLAAADLARPVRFAPVSLSGTLVLDAAGGGMAVSGPLTVTTPEGRALARARLRHDISDGAGRLDIDTGPVRFSGDGLQPQAAVPALSGIVAAVTGEAALAGRIAWSRGGLGASSGAVELRGIGLQAPAARFEGVTGRVAFSSLWPVRTDGPQTVEIGLLDPGVPLAGGRATVEIAGGGEVVIRNAEWPFAGGALVVTSEALRPGAEVQRAELQALSVDLGQFLALIDLDGLTGTGALAGRVPVEIREGSVFVRAAVLEAEPGGTIRYRSETAEAAGETAEGASLAFRALENFRFRVLRVEVDGPVDGDLTVRVALEGSNPDVYEGYPIKLNIRTEGAFMELVRRGTVGFRPLDVISGDEDLRGIEVERVDPEPAP